MGKLLLSLGLAMSGTLLFTSLASAQSASSSASAEDGSAITARGADTVPLNPDGTCPEGYVTVNAPFCAEESPNTPGRIFGYGEGDLASATASPVASTSAEPCGGRPTRVTPDGIQCSNLPDVAFGSASPDASASASSSASVSASTFPETGGPISLMALAPLALLAGSGILTFRVIRRS